MDGDRQLREMLARQLDWEDAHVGYAHAVEGFPVELRGVAAPGFVHSPWQLVEHVRLAQADILDFCVNPDYVYPTSMAEYWPDVAPASEAEWDASVAGFEEDVAELKRLALDHGVDLFSRVPAGTGQTYLRELLVVVDHNSYHVGQLVALRRALGAWHERPGWRG
jgi:hypothetical protein